jgi:peptidoglycan hydrolase CwlO-like protein
VYAEDFPNHDFTMGHPQMSENQLKKYHTQLKNKQNAPQKIIKLQTRVTSLEQLQTELQDRVEKLEEDVFNITIDKW